jgi:regulator of replication initiation timing
MIGAKANDRRDTMAHERFPTLRETRSARPQAEAQAEPETGVTMDQLDQTREAMETVLAENERLKRRVTELQDRLDRTIAVHNAQIEKERRRRKGANRG